MSDRAGNVFARLAQASGWRQINGPLFRKYVALFVGVVCVVLLANGMFEIGFAYQEHKASLIRIQREQAEAAAAKIGQFIKEIESQVGWTTQLPWSAGTIDQRKFDGLRLLKQVPAVTELAQLDSSGKEQLRVSRLSMDVVASQTDFSKDPKFTEAVAKKVYYGPVYFRRESEPYMTLALAGTRRDAGVSVAEVNLKLIWDVVTGIKVGERGHAYAIDAQGRLIAHPDISLVLRNTDMTRLTQVAAARAAGAGVPIEPVQVAKDVHGREVLTAYAPVAPLGWLMFVELPADEANAPLYDAIWRSAALLLVALRSPSCPAFSSRGAWWFRSRPCGWAPPASAAATSRSASPSRRAMNLRRSPTNSTAWPNSCRTRMRVSSARSRNAPTSSNSPTWRNPAFSPLRAMICGSPCRR